MTKTQYLTTSILRYWTRDNCPYCNGKKSKVVSRKYMVTTLNECVQCKLLFRHPLDTIKFNRKFYQSQYEQNDGITATLPSEDELRILLSNNFKNSSKDYSGIVNQLINLLGGTGKIIDYGANWGYTSYQFQQAGFEVQSYESSRPRAAFGKRLGVNIYTDTNHLKPDVDIFFSSLVIEHLPDIKTLFLLAQTLLKEDGWFVAFCPNGSGALRQINPILFKNFWGQVHPNCLSAEFFSKAFQNVPYLIGSELATGVGN